MLIWSTPVIMVLGIFLLVWCIVKLVKIASPAVRYRLSGSAQPDTMQLPQPGRYTVNIIFPFSTVITGVAHFAARFTIRAVATGEMINYQAQRFAPFGVTRSDMSGNTSFPLGYFICREAGEYIISCLNPECIRRDFRLEVIPYISPLLVVPLILGIIAAAGMAIGGGIVFLLAINGRI